jgi:hypothetical protein
MVIGTHKFRHTRFNRPRTFATEYPKSDFHERLEIARNTPIRARADFIFADTPKGNFRVAEAKDRWWTVNVLDIVSKAELLQRIELLEERIKSLENALPKEKIVILREIPMEKAEKEILELFSKGQTLYYSDIAEQLGLDLKLVVEICNKLQTEGKIEVVDHTLQRR